MPITIINSFFRCLLRYPFSSFKQTHTNMASSLADRNQTLCSHVEIQLHNVDSSEQKQADNNDNDDDYFQRAQWLRAAMLGANDGLVTVASLMMGVGSVKNDVKAMLLAGFAGLVAGACSMAIGEFVSVYTQYDIEMSQMKREAKDRVGGDSEIRKKQLPNPTQAAMASALAFSAGALAPLLAAAFINEHKLRMAVVAVVASLALLAFGCVGAVLGRTPVVRSCARVVIGGWMAMAITFGLTKLIASTGLQM